MTNALWGQRLLYFLISLLFILWLIVPQNPLPQALPTPEFLLCFTLAIILRRPEALPVILIAIIFLFCDVLFNRPIGLWTAIVIIISEFAKTQYWRYKDSNFVTTWFFISFLSSVGIFLYMIVLDVLLVPQSNFWQYLIWALITILIYPFMFCLSFLIVGFDKQNYERPFVRKKI